MLEQAEKNGILIPGQSVVIEPTSRWTPGHAAEKLVANPLPRRQHWYGVGIQLPAVLTGIQLLANAVNRYRTRPRLRHQGLQVGSSRPEGGLTPRRCIITLPAKMSLEKEVLLRSLGAEVVRTPYVSLLYIPAHSY